MAVTVVDEACERIGRNIWRLSRVSGAAERSEAER